MPRRLVVFRDVIEDGVETSRERLVHFFDDIANDLPDGGRFERSEKAAVGQNRREDIEIFASLRDASATLGICFWGAMRAMQHDS